MKTNKTKQISHYQNSLLTDVILKAKQIEKFNQIFIKYIDMGVIPHCRVANFRESILLIEVDSGAWVTQLRYHTPELLRLLKMEAMFKSLQQIKFYVNPNKVVKKVPASKATVRSIDFDVDDKSFDGIKDKSLRQSMARLESSYKQRK